MEIRFEEYIEIKASPKDIYLIYADVKNWNKWDKEVKDSCIYGLFETGTYGSLTPKKGLKSKNFIKDMILNHSFTLISKFPFCIMVFEHELIVKKEITEVTHRVTFSGLLSFLFGKLIGTQIQEGLPSILTELKNRAELHILKR